MNKLFRWKALVPEVVPHGLGCVIFNLFFLQVDVDIQGNKILGSNATAHVHLKRFLSSVKNKQGI